MNAPSSPTPGTSKPATERLIFAPAVEALLVRGIAGHETADLENALRTIGVDVRRLLPAYPCDTFQAAIDLVSATVYPDLPRSEAQWKLGENTVYGFQHTLVGKAMATLVKLIGPRRALIRFPNMSRSSNNFSRLESHEVTPNEFQLICEPYVGSPEYFQGCISAVIDITGGKDPKVELISHDVRAERIVVRASWSA